jgi:hypothetical protein
MLNRFFLSGALQVLFVSTGLFFLVFLSKDAQSQQCDAPYETVTRFDKPDPGAAMVWQTFYNQYGSTARERQASFISSYGLDNGDVLIVGQVQLMKNVRPSLLLVKFNDRGRSEWEKIHSIPHMKEIVKIVPDGEGSAVLVNTETPKGYRYFWIGFFDKSGGLKSFQTIKDKQFEMIANDIHPSIDKEGWAIPVSVVRKWGGDPAQAQKNASIYLLNKEGKKRGMRSYILGVRTELLHVGSQTFAGENKGYIATGYFENDSKKRIAWVMRLNPDLSMVWQKEYGRGISAKLVKSAGDKNGDVLIVGDVNSAESDIRGAWIAKLDGEYGNVLWQRYYASKNNDYSYDARNVVQHDDGRISFLMLGKVVDKNNHNIEPSEEASQSENKDVHFGHLLMLSPLGLIMSGDAYYAGYGSYVSSMSMDSLGQLVLVGNSWQRSYVEVRKQREKNSSEVVPLRDEKEIHLPDVQLSDKTRQGLALLQKKISAQDVIEDKNDGGHGAELNKNEDAESAKSSDGSLELLQKGWVFAPELDNTYKDPCK